MLKLGLGNFFLLIKHRFRMKNRKDFIAGSLSHYTNKSLIKNEDRGWKQHIEEKHKV